MEKPKYGLVALSEISPSILLDIRYASRDNFIGRQLYPGPFCYLQIAAARRLDRVQKGLLKRGLGLKVFDGYRPLSVTRIFWDFLPDARYCADPAVGSKHNRGAAVDLTLTERGINGSELAMPSGFDEMNERAHRSFGGAPQEALLHRQILQDAMVKEGFIPLETEWWHFDDPDWENYPVLDVSFEQLSSLR